MAQQCTAMSKQTGQRCKRAVTPGRTVCHYHGGATPRGVALPQFKTGRYSKALPDRLAARYEEAASDPNLLALREDIALLDSRLEDVLKRADTGEAGRLWSRLRELKGCVAEAQSRGDVAEREARLAEMLAVIDEGAADWAIWAEVLKLLEARRKLVESERGRLVQMHQILTAEEAMALMAGVVAVVKEEIHDLEILGRISSGIDRLLHRGT